MDERMKGTLSERGRNIKHRRQNLSKKGAKIEKNGIKIDPKGSQNEAKTDKKSKQPRQDDLGPPGWRFPGYRATARCHLGCQNRAKFVKKVMRKIVDFFIALGSEKSEKKESKTTPKWSPRWSKIEPRRKDKTKMGKV